MYGKRIAYKQAWYYIKQLLKRTQQRKCHHVQRLLNEERFAKVSFNKTDHKSLFCDNNVVARN